MSFFTRKTPRAQRYDYSSEGMYFITICTKDRIHHFGDVVSRDAISARPKESERSVMMLSDIGKICDEHIRALPSYWDHIDIHEHIVMPNHVHILLYMGELKKSIDDRDTISGRDTTSACPDDESHRTARDAVPTTDGMLLDAVPTDNKPKPSGPPFASLGYIINGLKGGITKTINKQIQEQTIPSPYGLFARQPRYHDIIVRDEKMYENIKYYTQTNPEKRHEDKFYTH